MEELFRVILSTIAKEEGLVLVTVTASSGSTPRGSGARMLVSRAGRIFGTVGGGAVEFEAIKQAGELLRTKRAYCHEYFLCRNEIEDIGMICGGHVRLHFQYLDLSSAELKSLAEAGQALCQARKRGWLIQKMSGASRQGRAATPAGAEEPLHAERGIQRNAQAATPADAEQSPSPLPTLFSEEAGWLSHMASSETEAALEEKLRTQGRLAFTVKLDDGDYFIEELILPGFVYVFGGGHVAQALVPVLAAVDFAAIVLEDRDEFLEPSLFPGAYAVRRVHFEEIERTVKLNARDYVCIMTRGHAWDLELQAQVLRSDAQYIGVIGSRSKRASTDRRLRERGYTDKDIRRVISPIGVDIGGETPAEIAVSIVAQLIMQRSGKLNQSETAS